MFKLNDKQAEKFNTWRKEQEKKVAELQKDKFPHAPYYGCSGGAYTYTFTPTSLGLVTTVINNVTNEEINLTDYDAW